MEHKQKMVQRRRDVRGRSLPLEYLSDYDLRDEEEEPAMEHKQKRVPRRRDARGRLPPKPLEYLSDYDLGDEEEEPPMEHKQRRVPKRRATRGRSPPKPLMRRGPQGRAQPQSITRKCCLFLSVIFVLLVITVWRIWF
jgi:hypothetical protein